MAFRVTLNSCYILFIFQDTSFRSSFFLSLRNYFVGFQSNFKFLLYFIYFQGTNNFNSSVAAPPNNVLSFSNTTCSASQLSRRLFISINNSHNVFFLTRVTMKTEIPASIIVAFVCFFLLLHLSSWGYVWLHREKVSFFRLSFFIFVRLEEFDQSVMHI